MSIENLDPTASKEQKVLFTKILIIEPDAGIAEMLTELFLQEGYDSKIQSGCKEIIRLVENFKPSLVLIEYLLPDVNGGELCSQIKNDPRFSDIPVILYSGYPQILWSVKDYGCDEFLAKPFDIDVLLKSIERLLNRSKVHNRFSFLAETLKNRLIQLGRFHGTSGKNELARSFH